MPGPDPSSCVLDRILFLDDRDTKDIPIQPDSTLAIEKPENGVAGLKHWRHDLLAGLVVSLVSLPFSLGIAVASGAPPVCGLISAIIAGLVLPFLGGSYVTISGPAAGLAPALFAAMLLLGRGDRAVGYPLLLGAICLTGLVQVVLAKFKLARFSRDLPRLGGRGDARGDRTLDHRQATAADSRYRKFEAHEFWGIVRETPSQFMQMDPKVFLLGIFCLALIFALASIKARWVKVVPPQVIAAVVGLILGWFLGLDGDRLIHIPDQPFKHGIVLPNFHGLFTEPLALVGALHDGPDPDVDRRGRVAGDDRGHRQDRPVPPQVGPEPDAECDGHLEYVFEHGRRADDHPRRGQEHDRHPDRCADPVGQLLQRLLPDHLPAAGPEPDQPDALYRPGGDRPLHRLQAVRPKVWKHVAHIGSEQLFVFTTTVLVTVTTDLLWGIAAGIVAKLLLEIVIVARVERGRPEGHEPPAWSSKRWLGETGELFRDPVVKSVTVGGTYHMYFGRPMVCFNSLHLNRELSLIPSERHGGLPAHHRPGDADRPHHGHRAPGVRRQLQTHRPRHRHDRRPGQAAGAVTRRSRDAHQAPVLAQERAEAMTALARISMTSASARGRPASSTSKSPSMERR